LAAATGTPVKSLMRVFGPNGNPTAANLSDVIRVLQKKTGVHLEVLATASAARRQIAVMAGLDPAIHDFLAAPKEKTWMPGHIRPL